MTAFSTLVIGNPKGGGGRAKWLGARLEALLAEYAPHAKLVWTQKPGEATELARQGLKDGFQLIASGGGDGTLNEVINGFFEDGKLVRSDAILGILPLGTGSDFSRSFGWSPYLKPAVMRLAGRKTTPCDVGTLTCQSAGGVPISRYFLNIADVGIVPEIMNRVNPFPKFLGARISYIQGIIRAFTGFHRRYVDLTIDDCHKGSLAITNIFIANGQASGGGFRSCPEAKIDDGLFDLLLVGNVGLGTVLRALPGMTRGKLPDHPELKYFRGRRIEIAESIPGHVAVEADGETLGFLPAKFEVLKHKIRIKV